MNCNHKGECFGACSTPKSPVEINHEQAECAKACAKEAAGGSNASQGGMHEHDKVTSRITGKKVEISMGPHGGALVPINPFASLAQEGYMHAHPEILGKKGLKEWDIATKGKNLPKRV